MLAWARLDYVFSTHWENPYDGDWLYWVQRASESNEFFRLTFKLLNFKCGYLCRDPTFQMPYSW